MNLKYDPKSNKPTGKIKASKEGTIKTTGEIEAELCGSCGHHSLGVRTKGGEWLPLKPGMRVTIERNKK